MEAWEREAREEIRELVASYTHLGDGGRVDEVAELFEPTGVLELSDRGVFTGRDAIAGALGGLSDQHVSDPGVSYVRHHVTNLTIDVESPHDATGAAYWLVVTNTGLWKWGRYRDVYRRQDGGSWRFAHRRARGDAERPRPTPPPASTGSTGEVGDASLLARIERLEGLHEIGQLAHGYAQAADARDLDGILGMFVEDVDCGRFGTGRDALRASYQIVHRQFYRTIHQVVGHTIDLVDADHATGRVVMRAEHEVGERWVVVLMCLFDSYERRDGAWYFVRRKPETWYAADITERPHGPDWTAEGWGDNGRRPRLPHLFSTWEAFWQGHDDLVRQLTPHP
jgi:ketosteroid isomerase-like protein